MHRGAYDFVRSNEEFGNLPRPSSRTLDRRIEHIVFRPGVCVEGIK